MAEPTLVARMRRSLRYRGPRRTAQVGWELLRYRLRHGLGAPRPHAIDLEFGTVTAAMGGGHTFIGDATLGTEHEPIDTVDFAELMAGLAIDHRRFLFVDFGSGLGRGLILASAYPFARILGIEYARELYERAQRNLEIYAGRKFRGQRCHDIANIWADAATWELPNSATVFYLCEPFHKEMMGHMVARIEASLRVAPRPVYALYVGDRHRELWEDSGRWAVEAALYWSRVYRWAGAVA